MGTVIAPMVGIVSRPMGQHFAIAQTLVTTEPLVKTIGVLAKMQKPLCVTMEELAHLF